MSRRLLVVAAHPDDEVLGCGGLLARTLRGGGEALVLILTEGCSVQYPDRPELIAEKQAHARQAMTELGEIELEFAGLPDMGLGTLGPAEVAAPVTAAVRRYAPDWVLAHHHGDLNRDHRIAHEAARVACRPTPEARPRLLTFETLSSTEWGVPHFEPNLYVTLEEDDLARKIRALERYTTETRAAPHPRSADGVRNLARYRGSQAAVPLAEAFRSVWERL